MYRFEGTYARSPPEFPTTTTVMELARSQWSPFAAKGQFFAIASQRCQSERGGI
ncbi:MAG: hypothetical protein SW833_07815 [Cyanobacteriota bacterium]|nr:hypothetical protein [Cyanobacteriota bacterium]